MRRRSGRGGFESPIVEVPMEEGVTLAEMPGKKHAAKFCRRFMYSVESQGN